VRGRGRQLRLERRGLQELQHRRPDRRRGLRRSHRIAERLAQTADGAGVQLRHSRFVDADLLPDLLHRDLSVVVEADHLALARGQRRDRAPHAFPHFGLLVRHVRPLRLRWHEHGGQRPVVAVIGSGEGRGGFDRVDADDRAVQALLVDAGLGGQVRDRGLASELAAQFLAGGLELAPLPAHAARPRVLAQRVDHRAADTAFREGFKLDAPAFVKPVRGVDEPDDAVLNEIADVDGVRHR